MKRRKFMMFLLMMLTLSLVLSGCSFTEEASPLNPQGSVGESQLFLINLSLGIMFGVLAVVFALFFYAIIRFRRKKSDKDYPEQVEGSHKLEIIWTVIPLILITILAVPTVIYAFVLGEDLTEDPDVLLVEVVGHQYWWEFNYPQLDIYTAQDLVMPVDKTVAFKITASDVLHSFWIPGLGGKMDAIPGTENVLYYDANTTGVLKGKCVELCGQSHALMDFKAVVLEQDEFDTWVEDMKTPYPEEVENVELAEGYEIFKNNCISCHAIDATQKGIFPNLKGFANRETVAGFKDNNAEEIKAWIEDPNKMKPGVSDMPAFENVLSDEELDKLVEYLQSLD
ncbi:cytochrome c oxidase subunit II [Longirhabdus pacifica]|uniref:cytochrome c oxidase subunit II n=1 Tax=Longirhabdus pacifica TaxID=2305227 RepID=UPI001F0BF5FD|nr:cytochrome c oxidase subunit II [Longirhabdus pacifica]